jgi:hypothetical protein
MPNSLIQMKDSVLSSFNDIWNHVLNFTPTLLGALVLLVFGWMLSHYVGRVVRLMLTKIGFEKASLRSGLHGFLHQSGTRTTASHLTGDLSKWFVRLIFIQAAASVLGMPQVTQVINSIILFIPKVIVAMVIVVAGSLVSHFLSNAVRGSTSKIGGTNPALVAKLTRWLIMGFAVIAAISQLEIAENIVNTLFMGFTGSVALAFGLAFGLGGRDTAAEICKGWYRRSQAEDRSSHIRKAS